MNVPRVYPTVVSLSLKSVVPTTLNIAWKIPCKILLIMHPWVTTEWKASSSLLTKDQETLTKPLMLGRVISEKNDNAPTRDIAKDSMACINVVSHAHHESGSPLNKGIKIPSKLLSLKYQSQSSLGEQNRNSSSPKHVHFINIITIISKEDELRETGIVKPNATKENDHDTIVEVEENIGEEFSGSEIVIKEARSRDVERDNPDDRACGDTKEVEEG
ncbi:hypothetical protein Tco_1211970 [Tanacetum coccineum]